MGGDEVDARAGTPAVGGVQVAGSGESRGEIAEHLLIPAPVAAHGVAVAPVPLRPVDGEVADVIAALAGVPRLGDQPHRRQGRILHDDVEERRLAVIRAVFAPELRGQVEPEAVDPHLRHPVAQAVGDELQRARMAEVDRVAGAGEVICVPGVVGEVVIRLVVDPAKRQRRPELAALGGVVVDDVEEHLDPGPVQRIDHALELRHHPRRIGGGGEPRIGREVAERVVAPVVAETLIDEELLADAIVHRQQLDGGDAQRRQMRDRRRRGQPGVRAPDRLRHVGVQLGHALDMHLVDHEVGELAPRHGAVAPGVGGGVDHRRQRRMGGAVTRVERQVGVGIADRVAEQRLVVAEVAPHRPGVGVEQQLVDVASCAALGLVGPVDPDAVQLAGAQVGEVAVPDLAAAVGQREPLALLGRLWRVEQAQVDAGGRLGEHGHVDAVAVPGHSERIRLPVPDAWRRHTGKLSRPGAVVWSVV